MKYSQYLTEKEIQTHTQESHSLWGGRQSLDQRFTALIHRLKNAGRKTFFMSGLIDDQGKLVASMKRYHFPLNVEGKSVLAVGLGAIFTSETHRKQGLASELIRKVLSESHDQLGCEAAVLYSDIETAFYESFGFTSIRASNWKSSLDDLPTADPLQRRAARPDDVPALISWYKRTASRYPLSTERTTKTWPLFREINQVEKDLVLMNGAQEIGFLSYTLNPDPKYFWVEEFCTPESFETRVWATIRKLADEYGCKEVRGWSMPSYSLKASPTEARKNAVPMVKLLSGGKPSPKTIENALFSSPDHF